MKNPFVTGYGSMKKYNWPAILITLAVLFWLRIPQRILSTVRGHVDALPGASKMRSKPDYAGQSSTSSPYMKYEPIAETAAPSVVRKSIALYTTRGW